MSVRTVVGGRKYARHSALTGCLGILIGGVSSLAQQTPANMVKVPDGTIVQVTLTQDLNSGTAHQNDIVHGEVAEDLKVGDTVVIAKGAPVTGRITQAEPKGKWGHSGTLGYSLDYAKSVDGASVRLRASSTQGGQQSTAALMLGLSGAFKHGKDIDVPKGTTMSAYVDGDHTVTIPESKP
jgi:hypothetical protein